MAYETYFMFGIHCKMVFTRNLFNANNDLRDRYQSVSLFSDEETGVENLSNFPKLCSHYITEVGFEPRPSLQCP